MRSGLRCLLFLSSLHAQTLPTWTILGPRAINGRTADLESGKLQTFAAASDPKILYTAGGLGSGSEGPYTGAGVFKSTDGGAHWTSINTGLADPFVNALWVDSADANKVAAGTEYDGLYFSTDGGASWTRTGNYTAASEFLAVGSVLYAGVATGIVRSTD